MRSLLIKILIGTCLPLVTLAQEGDTIKRSDKYFPTGVRFGTDVLSIGRSVYDNSFDGWEVNADVDFHRFYLAVDYGEWAREYSKNDLYKNDGRYWRAGVDVNFLTKDVEKNMFFLGLRYGQSKFSERLLGENKQYPPWGLYAINESHAGVKGSWFELTTGIKVKIWKMLWMGYTARLKFALSTNETQDLIPHDVPGYGRTDKNSTWGFNYQIFLRIPVRKSKALTTEQRKKTKF